MVSTWSSGSTFQTTAQQNKLENEKTNHGLTFVDFLPECRSPAGFFTKAVYETFRSLVDRANDWLRANPHWEIVTCESVEFKDKGNAIDSEKMIYLEYGERSTWYIRGLRLWLVKKKKDFDKSQQIGYLNLIPQQSKEGGFFSSPLYESLDEVIERFNTMIRHQPIPGRIITIESQEMKMKNANEIDPDKSSWVERGTVANNFLYVIRIFYEITESYSEEIGIQDFVPDILEQGGVFSMPQYELFSSIVDKASYWCSRQTDVRICNAQSLEIKIKRGSEINTQMMHYVEHGGRTTFYVRILRVTYTKSSHSNFDSHISSVSQLTCRTFVPLQLTTGLFIPEFETLQETKARITAWMRATGAQPISVETAALRILTGGEAKQGTEASFTFNQAERDEYWIFVVRVYINGTYKEPPEDMLPPIPELEEQTCCVMF